MAEEECGVVPEGPVVVERVDGSGQWLQDAVHDAGHQAAHVRAQVQVGVLDQTLDHVEEPVELLQVVTHRLDLKTVVHQMSKGNVLMFLTISGQLNLHHLFIYQKNDYIS